MNHRVWFLRSLLCDVGISWKLEFCWKVVVRLKSSFQRMKRPPSFIRLFFIYVAAVKASWWTGSMIQLRKCHAAWSRKYGVYVAVQFGGWNLVYRYFMSRAREWWPISLPRTSPNRNYVDRYENIHAEIVRNSTLPIFSFFFFFRFRLFFCDRSCNATRKKIVTCPEVDECRSMLDDVFPVYWYRDGLFRSGYRR